MKIKPKETQHIPEEQSEEMTPNQQAMQKVIEKPEHLQELEEIIEEALEETRGDEIDEETIKQFEEMEAMNNCDKSPATKQDIEEIKNFIAQSHLNTSKELINCHKDVNHRSSEYINLLNMIFDRLKFIKKHMTKWFVTLMVISFICGGVTFTTIYHHWDNLSPHIDKILGIAKTANNISKVGG